MGPTHVKSVIHKINARRVSFECFECCMSLCWAFYLCRWSVLFRINFPLRYPYNCVASNENALCRNIIKIYRPNTRTLAYTSLFVVPINEDLLPVRKRFIDIARLEIFMRLVLNYWHHIFHVSLLTAMRSWRRGRYNKEETAFS